MTKKHGRAEIRFKLEHDLYDAAEEAFHEAGFRLKPDSRCSSRRSRSSISKAKSSTSRMMYSRPWMN